MTLAVSIPGFGDFVFACALFDFNGTLACDGVIIDSTLQRLNRLSFDLDLYIMSADTHGTLSQVTADLPATIRRVSQVPGGPEKKAFLDHLGCHQTIVFGNGRNDAAMLEAAALGITILGCEGAAAEALLAADLVFVSIDDALDSLISPQRLVASLRG
jgi:soluble P-type ATPase